MRPRRAAAAALAGAALATGAVPAAHAASRTVTVDGWAPRAMAFGERALVWGEAATVRVDPRRFPDAPAGARAFSYYRAEAFRAPLDRRSRRFLGTPETLLSIRESIAAMTPGALGALPGNGVVFAPFSPRFAAPVTGCCTPDGDAFEVESDGRPDAPRTIAAAWDGAAVRWVQLAPDGAQVLRSQGEAAPLVTGYRSAPGLAALGGERWAWADPAAPTTLQVLDGPAGGAPRAVRLPGPALGVWASPGLAAVLVRAGGRFAVLRVDAGGAVRVWSGARRPRVATGGGAVALADGPRVWAARRGALRLVRRAPRAIDGVGVDGRRLAWAERGLRRGARVAAIRLTVTP